jgi:hypothetical protein
MELQVWPSAPKPMNGRSTAGLFAAALLAGCANVNQLAPSAPSVPGVNGGGILAPRAPTKVHLRSLVFEGASGPRPTYPSQPPPTGDNMSSGIILRSARFRRRQSSRVGL